MKCRERTHDRLAQGAYKPASSYDQQKLAEATISLVQQGQSYRDVAQRFNIPVSTLHNKVHRRHSMDCGGPTVLSHDEENRLVNVIQTLSAWRQPVDTFELRLLVKSMLDKAGSRVNKFKENMPGNDWARLFLKRHQIVRECQKNGIRFVFLPANSTHLTQPLDVAFFRPLKLAWRKILCDWKAKQVTASGTIPKEEFPRLLKQLEQSVEFKKSENLIAGFRKCGIHPLNPQEVLKRLPEYQAKEISYDILNDSVLKMLKSTQPDGKDSEVPKKRMKWTRVKVRPGKSVSTDDFLEDNAVSANEAAGSTDVKNACRKKVGQMQVKPTVETASSSDSSTEDDVEPEAIAELEKQQTLQFLVNGEPFKGGNFSGFHRDIYLCIGRMLIVKIYVARFYDNSTDEC